tara:strand:- start:2 stop:844 length:843 start_codon:yes stop_codon:yes gene_type:complete
MILKLKNQMKKIIKDRTLLLVIIIGLIICGVIFIFFYKFSRREKIEEGFTWTQSSTNDFLLIQQTINKSSIFDVKMIQENQASQEELDYFLENKMWPWSKVTQDLFEEANNKNPYIRTYSKDAIIHARTKYNERAILLLLSYQTKEGHFLINGVLVKNPLGNPDEELPNGYGDFVYNAGLKTRRSNDIIKCNMDNLDDVTLERTHYSGRGLFGEQLSETSRVDYKDLENIIPGFSFVKEKCNPCAALNTTADYSCPFNLDINDKPSVISNVWSYLWNVNK